MELLLNLSWLLLAMPALWLWRESARRTGRGPFRALQGMFCLGCALVLLFPVVSATDDLRVMRAEMEESPTGKRSIGQSGGERGSAPRTHAQPMVAIASFAPMLLQEGHVVSVFSPLSIPESPTAIRPGRAPPQFEIA